MLRSRVVVPTLAVAMLVLAGSGPAARVVSPTPISVDAVDYAYAMPSVVKGGVVAMRFRNRGKEFHEFAFGRIDKGHTLAQALRAYDQGKRVGWLHDLGGPGILTVGADITITRTLGPGTYYFFCALPNRKGISHVKLGMARAFRVAGDSGARLPTADAVITAEKKEFIVPQLRSGVQTIELRNRSGSGRGFELATLNPGKTQADVSRWVKSIEKTGKLPAGPMPMTLLGAMQTIPTGTSVFVTVKLEAGRLYNVSDDESGIRASFTPR